MYLIPLAAILGVVLVAALVGGAWVFVLHQFEIDPDYPL